jgi:hypothetical protein
VLDAGLGRHPYRRGRSARPGFRDLVFEPVHFGGVGIALIELAVLGVQPPQLGSIDDDRLAVQAAETDGVRLVLAAGDERDPAVSDRR